jgi:glucosamine kinase
MSEIVRSSPLFLCVDGGGSKTVAVVLDGHGHVCGRGRAGGANYHAVGVEKAVERVRKAARQAMMEAGGALPCAAAWVGLAGIDAPVDDHALSPHLRMLAGTVRLTNDAELLLGALDRAIGVALVAGTGTIALGRDAHGTCVRASGWGHILGDEGSGYDLGHSALQAATRAADGRGPQTSLLERIVATWQLPGPIALIEHVHSHADKTKALVASLAPAVFAAAQEGDAVAARIIRRAAADLAQAALTVARKLDLPESLPLALGGSLLTQHPEFCEMIVGRLQRFWQVEAGIVVNDPAVTAAQMLVALRESEILL